MKAKLGQNFLVSATAQRAIVDALGDVHDQVVFEIGPGKAAITDLLAKRARRVVAIEVDSALAAALQTRFVVIDASSAPVEILHQDVLGVDLTELARRTWEPVAGNSTNRPLEMNRVKENVAANKVAVIGNLPYYITSDILLHLFAHSAVIGRAVLMIQREVADRIVAEPGTSDYGMLSATCQLYGQVERLFTLPPEAFAPPPQVHSSVVRLRFAPRFKELNVEPAPFIAHLRSCFAQKRKTLANNLRTAGYRPHIVQAAIEQAGVSLQARAETLTLEEQARLFHALR